MTYYINPMVFYWMSIADIVKQVSFGILIIAGTAFILITILKFCEFSNDDKEDEEYKKVKKASILLFIVTLISLILAIFVPSKKTCIEMTIANTVTQENVETSIENAKEIIDYIYDKANNVNTESEE